VCGQVIFILTAVGGNLRFASTEDALTSAYDRPPQKSAAVNALWAAAARPRARAAHEKRCLITDSASSLSSVTRVGEDTARTDDAGPAADGALRRHRERNRSAAVKGCSESMLGSLLWMSGHLRTRMAALCSDGGRIDWMGQCNPTAPTDVWPGALPSRSRHARSRRCDTLAVAGARDQWIPEEKDAVWGRLWSRPEPAQKLRLQLPPFFVPEPTIELPVAAPP
jgi:hypothetical protein